MRHLALLPKFLAVHLKTMVQYRADFAMGFAAQIVYTLLTVVFVDAFLLPGENLQGFAFWHVIFLFGFGDLAFGLSAVFMFRVFLSFESTYIVMGRLDQLMVQPVPILYALVLRNMDLNQLAVVAKGAALVAIAAHMLALPWSIAVTAKFALLVVCAAAVYAGMYLAFVSLGFWFRRRMSLAQPLLSMSYLTQYPLGIYPGPLQFMLTFIVPLGLATFQPARAFLGIDSPESIVLLPGWILMPLSALVVAIGIGLFQLGLRTYVSSGT